jgi:hypothetical protein
MLQEKVIVLESTKLTDGTHSRSTSQNKIKVSTTPRTVEPDILGTEISSSQEETSLSQEEADEMINPLFTDMTNLPPLPDNSPHLDMPVHELYQRIMAGELVNRLKRSESKYLLVALFRIPENLVHVFPTCCTK